MESGLAELVEKLKEFKTDEIEKAVIYSKEQEEIKKDIASDEFFAEEHEQTINSDESVLSIAERSGFERIIDDPNFMPAYFLEQGAIKQKSVARIMFPRGGGATGFLISPSILMTNNHVFGSAHEAKNAKIQFNYQLNADGTQATVDEYATDPDSLFYTNRRLDMTIVRLSKKSSLLPIANNNNVIRREQASSSEYFDYENQNLQGFDFPPIDRDSIFLNDRPPIFWNRLYHTAGSKWGFIPLKKTVAYSNTETVNIIQHPRLRLKEVALKKNEITNIYQTRVRYKTDTQRGSSGSPVFNDSWELVALHHAAGERSDGNWISNQGVRIDVIVKDLKDNFSGTPTGQAILNELGIS